MRHEYTNEIYDSYEELREIKKRAEKNYVTYPRPQWKKDWEKEQKNG